MIVNLKSNDWQKIILGIRKKLNLSQSELSKKMCVCRQSISRFEAKQRIPNENSINKIINLIKQNNLEINELIRIGDNYSQEFSEREKIPKLNLKKSKELAELVGIILGDGEIKKDGTIRISFDPKKDKNFLYRRVFPLIHNLTNKKIGFESHKRISFGNIAFARYLKEDCNLIAGSKFQNNWEIPKWCFGKEEYLSAVLRGLFDTDGYFGYLGGSLELMLGRFSDKCTELVKSIESALRLLNFNPITKHTKDGRYRIRVQNKKDVIRFFMFIGTSNLKHIVRFLLWGIKRYEAKIEKEGLDKLIKHINKSINMNIKDVDLPFLWDINNKYFLNYIKKDLEEIKGAEISKLYKWPEITQNLLELIGNKNLAEEFSITERSVRKWKEGARNPSNKFTSKLIRLLKDNNLNIKEYKIKIENGKTNN